MKNPISDILQKIFDNTPLSVILYDRLEEALLKECFSFKEKIAVKKIFKELKLNPRSEIQPLPDGSFIQVNFRWFGVKDITAFDFNKKRIRSCHCCWHP